ncbi:MAG TPA: hypothetical protein VE053_16225 [Allosphingosinicella sp.]|nr:hypothetical protein [Allosphingosinicella sp.]
MDDLFGDVPQPIPASPQPERRPLTADDVRGQMLSLIATARAADSMPFEATELKRHIALFPIMARWLGDEEGQQLVFEFEAEIERLLAA